MCEHTHQFSFYGNHTIFHDGIQYGDTTIRIPILLHGKTYEDRVRYAATKAKTKHDRGTDRHAARLAELAERKATRIKVYEELVPATKPPVLVSTPGVFGGSRYFNFNVQDAG